MPPSGTAPADNITPNMMNLVVGETRPLQVLDANGAAVHGLTWAVTDATVASLSTDDPPILTALAPGHVTITAGDGSADVTVYTAALAPGTVIWSNPGDGSGVQQIMPAVPSSTGVADVFAIQASGNVQAITSDGTVAWTANLGYGASAIPDFQGGLLVTDGFSVKKLDGLTGQPYPSYTFPGSRSFQGNVVVHTDGTIFAPASDSVVVVNPITGGLISSSSVDHGRYALNGVVTDEPPAFGNMIVAGDGYAYVPYQYQNDTRTENGVIDTTHTDYYLSVLRIGSGGDATNIPVGSWSHDIASVGKTKFVPYGLYYCDDTCQYWIAQLGSYGLCEVYGYCYDHSAFCSDPNGCTVGDGYFTAHSGPQQVTVGNLITNSDQGVVLPFVLIDNLGPPLASTSYLATISTGGSVQIATANVPASYNPIQPVLQAQDGSFVGTMSTETGSYMVGFSGSGNLKWTVPGAYQPQIATADGGVIAQSPDGLTTVSFDQSGNVADLDSLPGSPSWQGFLYSFAGDPAVKRKIPPKALLKADLLKAANGNVAGTHTTLSLPDDPWSLRLVPTSDDGAVPVRTITYTLTKLDGKSRPNGTWYPTEHQTDFTLTPFGNGMSGSDATHNQNTFEDTVGSVLPRTPIRSSQTFTISLSPGLCAAPSYGNAQNTACKSSGAGTIVVHTPQSGDFGTLGIYIDPAHVLINGKQVWPGVNP